ncbi:YsnF/AvaK domain-containing protein [Nitrospira moscoviensis]|uniref:DUF2382 domain-containing protein n=1 Tax=Nitrospira moscoviensis TaxID=42253 RepID=A0A0K2GET5_NITMO|nr:YsnF/AvaK domain-containing protein [Nitrospira moscoviensis]ALA59127.1 hypothetical protein NITMOv2_2716 [Nitrospira moscoviensis]
MNTIVGLFENRTQALRAQSALGTIHIPVSDIKLYDQSAQESAGESDRGFWESLKEAFGFGEDRGSYEEGIRRGGTLVSVRADDARTEEIVDILSQYGAVDIDERTAEWRSSGRADTAASAPAGAGAATATGATVPVAEEELRVGKRDVRRGKVRVYREVTERPVEETVRLRDEAVNVERRPMDRPVTAETGLFQNETIEMTETDEEPVVSKQARIVEEVAIHKDVRERDETIRDTVRRADVRVEREGAGAQAGAGSPEDEEDYRLHWTQNYGAGAIPYEHYGYAYRFGSTLGSGRNLESSDWTQLEPEARRRWEERNQGTWDQFKDAVRYAWERGKRKVSGEERRAA